MQYKSDLMRMSFAFLKDAALAEDAVQETFVKAYQAMASFRGDSSEKTWLMRIAINTCRNIRRDSWFRFVDRNVTLETLPMQVASNEDRALIESVMNLPYKQREVVLLYYYQGLSFQEISETLGVAISTVSTRLKKAYERLRCEMEGGHEHE
jgi:RNA polymerase sigma-70 factor (ECF subfamily)